MGSRRTELTINRTIAARDLGKYERGLARTLPGVAQRVNVQAAQRSIGVLKRTVMSVRPHAPVDTKRYLNSFEVHRGPRSEVIVANDRRYAGVIEFGRRPNARRPPAAALIGWVRRKLGVSAREAPRVAFAVARKIGERGLPAKRVVSTATPEIIRVFTQLLFDANERFLRGRQW